MALAVMINNLLHDFSVAMLFCSMLTLILLRREMGRSGGPAALARVYRKFLSVMVWSLVFVVIFGIGRTLAYRQYEWHEAAGSGQVASLVVKHIILGGIVVAGFLYLLRKKKQNATVP